MQRTILGCSVLGLHLLKQEPLDISQAIDEALTVIGAVDVGQQPEDDLITIHALLTTAYLASQTVEAGETQCLLPQHQEFYRAATALQFLPEVPLKQKAITLLLLQLILDNNRQDTVFSIEPATKPQLIDRVDFLNRTLLKCLSKNQSFPLMWHAFNPTLKYKIVQLSEQDKTRDRMEDKIQSCEAIEASSQRRTAEINVVTQALKAEFEHRKQEIRNYYAAVTAVECSKIDSDTEEMKRIAKRQREKDAVRLLVITAASAGAATCAGVMVESSMLAANAAASTAAAGAGAAVAAPTLTFTQTMALGAAKSLTMSTVQAAMTGDNILKRALEGGVLGAAAAGVNFKLGTTAQTFKGQAIQAATSASLQTAFHGGNLGQNIVMAVAANTVAHAVLPMDKVHLDGKSLMEVSLRTAGHASVMAATAAALHASPEARANIVIAAVGGMITPIAESAGKRVGERVVTHQQKVRQEAVFKQELVRVSEHASEVLKLQGVHVPAETIKTKLQQHPALQGSPEVVQQRLIEIGQAVERGDAVLRSAMDHMACGVAWLVGSTVDILIPSAHASEIDPSVSRLPTKRPVLLPKVPISIPRVLSDHSSDAMLLQRPEDSAFIGAFVVGLGVEVARGLTWLAASTGPGLEMEAMTHGGWIQTDDLEREYAHFKAGAALREDLERIRNGIKNPQVLGQAIAQHWGERFSQVERDYLGGRPWAAGFEGGCMTGEVVSLGAVAYGAGKSLYYLSTRSLQGLSRLGTIARPVSFPEEVLVRNSLDKSKQNMLRMWDSYRDNPLPNSLADGLRLRTELAFQQAGILNAEGRLTTEAIRASDRALQEGSVIGNPRIRDMLIKDGSKIEDWTKRASPSITLPNGQRVRIHYYENTVTNKIDYSSHDFKVKGRVESLDGPIYRKHTESDFNGHLPKNK